MFQKHFQPLESFYAHWFHFHEGGLWLNRMVTFRGESQNCPATLCSEGVHDDWMKNKNQRWSTTFQWKGYMVIWLGKFQVLKWTHTIFPKAWCLREEFSFMQVAKCNFSLGDPAVFLALFVANPPPWHWDSWRTSDFLCRLRLYWAHVEMIEHEKWGLD